MIKELVEEMLTEHKEGERYFDALDSAIKYNKEILNKVFEMAINHNSYDKDNTLFIMSGKVGEIALELYPHLPLIVYNGGLRKGNTIKMIGSTKKYWDMYKKKSPHFFIDDSFYLGRTRNILRQRLGITTDYISNSFVAYDGGNQPKVKSLYKYFDYHNEDGTRK